jgi:hypothetical protein
VVLLRVPKFSLLSTTFLNLSFGKLTNIIDRVGSWGCITSFSSADCNDNPGTIYIQTTYDGGLANEQVPMPYTDYLVAASSASIASSAIQASSTVNSESSSSDTVVNDWVSHHKALIIGVIAAVVALLLICCTRAYFRRRKYTQARPAPAPHVALPPHYQHRPPARHALARTLPDDSASVWSEQMMSWRVEFCSTKADIISLSWIVSGSKGLP